MTRLNENIPITRLNENSPLTQPTEFSENEKDHVPDNPDPEPSSSDLSSKKSQSGYSSKKNKYDKKKNCRKNRKDDLSDPCSSNNYDSPNDSDYGRKQHKNMSHWEKDPIKLCARLMAKLLTRAYKSKITRFKMDEDLFQSRIYFLTFLNHRRWYFHNTQRLVK